MENKYIYLDHAATTYTDPEVFEAMKPYFTDKFYNPSSFYSPARECAVAVEKSRETVARWLNANDPSEIIFTGGGSESDNIAIFGIPIANRNKGKHIITSPIEHHAVLYAVQGMDELGFEHTIVPVDKNGVIDMEALKEAVRDDTVLITIMFANNEVGTIEPIREIGAFAKERGIFFHTDAVQAAGSLPIDVQDMNIDALSIASHKFYGPKGAGALYLRSGIDINPLIKGGMQEYGKRGGTHNTPGIVGLGKAFDNACLSMEENNKRITLLRNKLVKGIMERVPDVIFNGHPENRLPNNANFCFKYVESEAILLHLDMLGICVSAGSACTTGAEEPSHVLAALGVSADVARGGIRMSLGKGTTESEIDCVIESTARVLENLRKMSPLISG